MTSRSWRSCPPEPLPLYHEVAERTNHRAPSIAPSYHTIEHTSITRSNSPVPSYRTTDPQLDREGTTTTWEGNSTLSGNANSRSAPHPRGFFAGLFGSGRRSAQEENTSQRLLEVAANGTTEAAAKLLNANANLDVQRSSDGYTPLQIAIWRGKPELVMLLMRHGADPSVPNWAGETAVHIAILGGRDNTYGALSCSGVDISRVQSKQPLLHYWIDKHRYPKRTDLEGLHLLLKYGADVHARDILGNTALHHVMLSGTHLVPDIAAILLSYGADVNAKNRRNETPLYRACELSDYDQSVIRLLLKHHAEVNVLNVDGSTELTNAAMHGRWDWVTVLQSKKANFNAASLSQLKRLRAVTMEFGTPAQVAGLSAVYKLANDMDDATYASFTRPSK